MLTGMLEVTPLDQPIYGYRGSLILHPSPFQKCVIPPTFEKLPVTTAENFVSTCFVVIFFPLQ